MDDESSSLFAENDSDRCRPAHGGEENSNNGAFDLFIYMSEQIRNTLLTWSDMTSFSEVCQTDIGINPQLLTMVSLADHAAPSVQVLKQNHGVTDKSI